MAETHTKGEMHGCIVCGRLHQLYVVYDKEGRFVDCKVMSPGARRVRTIRAARWWRATTTARRMSRRAVERVYGKQQEDDQ